MSTRGAPYRAHDTTLERFVGHRGLRCSVYLDRVHYGALPPQTINPLKKKKKKRLIAEQRSYNIDEQAQLAAQRIITASINVQWIILAMNHHFLQQLLNLQMLVPREVNQLSQVSRVPACGPKFSKRFSKRSKMEDSMKLHLLFASKRQVPRQMKQETIWNSSRIISSDSLMTELQKTIQATLDARIFLLPSLINLPKPSCGPKFAESCQILALVPHWEMADQLVHPSD